MEEQQEFLRQAQRLTDQVEEIHARLRRHGEDMAEHRQAEKKGLAGLLRGLFHTPQPTEPEHERFMADAESLAAALAQALAALPPDAERQTLARRAVACFLAPKPLEDKTPEEWFMTAAEGYCLPLLPYLSREDLEYFHTAMLTNIPKRYRFPKQEQVLRRLEELQANPPL